MTPPDRDIPAARESGLAPVAAAAVCVVAVVLAYLNSFSGTFTFDDFPAIRDNPTIRSLWPLTRALSPPPDTGIGGRPIANLSLALNCAIGGNNVRSYHAGNLLLHLGSTLLLLGIVRRTLLAVGRPRASWLALVVALIWSVHPLLTASVVYLSQRTELLMGFFYLLTLYGFIRGCERGARRWHLTSIVACALGMLSKEVMVTAPVLVWLYDRTFVAGSFRGALRQRWRYYAALASTWLMLGYVMSAGLSQRSVGYGLGVSSGKYALTECVAIAHYVKLAFWPRPLVFDYGPVYAQSPALIVMAAILVAVMVAGTVRAVRRGSQLGFAAAAFLLLLAPTSSIVPVAEQPIAENRMYLPLAAVMAIAVVALHTAFSRRAMVAAVMIATLALMLLTFGRNEDYRSEIALWGDTVAKRPQNSRAQYNYALALADAGRPAPAVTHFERAIALNPRDPKYHNSLGSALLDLGRAGEAAARFAESIRLRPNHARTWYNHGLALFRSDDLPGAVARLERALQLDPQLADAQLTLGNVWFQRDQPQRALEHYEAALRLDPTLLEAHYNSGSACFELGRFEAAVGHYARSVELKPADAEARNNYGAALLGAGRPADAVVQFEEALRLKPDYADARSNLEVARSGLKRREQAR
ncbi:MAG: tetratricopeptide repeat protein [Opitutaceae bacterium]|nr:tetratricopeptide repeat protein [Opitutaceae bacterium]